jgi:SecD/SecF fusion protein
MDRNLIWKTVVIVLIVLASALYLWPPQEKLKQGLDLAGGTSLVYEIDTTDLEPHEKKGLAQSMIPILLKRIDPTHVANIVMRPQGDTRIEIQLPVASAETRKKRDAVNKAIESLEQENINLLKIRQSLSLSDDERQEAFEAYANNNPKRLEILDSLSAIHDERAALQEKRDTYASQMETISTELSQAGLDMDMLQWSLSNWAKQSPEQRRSEIETYVKNNIEKDVEIEGGLTERQKEVADQIDRYITVQNQRAPIVEKLVEPETGLNARWNAALADLRQLNLDIDSLQSVLELPAGSEMRRTRLEAFRAGFPDRADKIEAAIKAYDEYRVVGGRLDDPEDLKRMLKGSGVLEFRILATFEDLSADQAQVYREELASRGPKAASDSRYVWMEIEDQQAGINGITGMFGEKQYVLCSNQATETMLQAGDKKWTLTKARPTTDDQGRRAIGFAFDNFAAKKFFALTSSNIGKPLCILLDDQAISAPTINSAIHSSGIITGSFTPTQVMDMVNKLNAGSFPARLSEVPISEKSISATIGTDNRDQGIKAGLIGLAAVAVFMLGYYLLSGAIANVALAMNLVLILGVMAMLGATFTLPGIAGLILTIGMSVDANALIFERIREEQRRGSSLKAAIANGYARAFSTIFDSNITTFGVAFILYMAASEEIKGFAIVLMLGIAASMFTALFVTRVTFDWLTSKRILTRPLAMFGIFQNVNINWMGLRPVVLTVSSIMVLAGLGVFFFRDEAKTGSKYDIEFIGGTSVGIELKEGAGLDRAAVEQRINERLGNARVYAVGDTGRNFEISTTQTNNVTATLTFAAPADWNVQNVAELIEKTGTRLGKSLLNLDVKSAGSGVFQISTTRLNADMVEDVLNEAVGQNAVVSNVQVNEFVSDTVREVFGQYLSVRENLGLNIVSEQKIDMGSEDAAVLSDYLGGLKITAALNTPASVDDLEARISTIRFRPDMQDVEWYPHKILKTDLTEPALGEKLSSFVYVSAHPEAGYRELEGDEWRNFVANETSKLQSAASLETSLSSITQIDPSVGAQAKQKAIVAIVPSLIAIIAYIWIRFGNPRYGVAAIVALVHDVCITLGIVTACTYIAGTPLGSMLGIGDFKINMEMIAAFLTIIGYSLNDTIVVFDRIRENRGRLSLLTPDIVNGSINQTLSRTTLTSFTTFLAVLIMYIWGGPGLRGFTFAMMVGIIVGTYSSIAIAAPILLIGENRKADQHAGNHAKTA